jgi:hypothetical protein
MRRITSSLFLALVFGRLASAGTILYATAASTQGVDGFCVNSDGSLAPTPTTHVDTGGSFPRRLLVRTDPATGADGTLYVAETDRVEAFSIGKHGGLSGGSSIKPLTSPNMDPLDLALSEDGHTLYVPQSGQGRIAAYPLDPTGVPAKDFTSCVQGPNGADFQRVVPHGGLLYAAADLLGGRLSVYPINADGSLGATPDECKVGTTASARTPFTCPVSERRHLLTPRAFLIIDDPTGNRLYVESITERRILQFNLDANGFFQRPYRKKTKEVVDPCLRDANGKAVTGNFKYQKANRKTAVYQQYQDMVLVGGTIFASQFTHGRVDAFKLRPNGNIRKHPSTATKADVRGSPVGLAVGPGVLYVAAGDNDFVQAYHLRRSDGMLADSNPFSATLAQPNSFPNALAVAGLSSSCE